MGHTGGEKYDGPDNTFTAGVKMIRLWEFGALLRWLTKITQPGVYALRCGSDGIRELANGGVAPACFRLVHGHVRTMQQRFKIITLGSNADADGHAQGI
jgi:hypothetical protein